MKRREVLRALKIGIIRLLAPEVSWSISALDMAEMENYTDRNRRNGDDEMK